MQLLMRWMLEMSRHLCWLMEKKSGFDCEDERGERQDDISNHVILGWYEDTT